MDVRKKLAEIVKKAAYSSLPSNTEDFHLNMFVTNLLSHGVTVQEWIPVDDRLPEKKGEYLVVFHPCYWDDVKWDKVSVATDTFRGKNAWAKKKFQRVTHWMPLPPPPKGG